MAALMWNDVKSFKTIIEEQAQQLKNLSEEAKQELIDKGFTPTLWNHIMDKIQPVMMENDIITPYVISFICGVDWIDHDNYDFPEFYIACAQLIHYPELYNFYVNGYFKSYEVAKIEEEERRKNYTEEDWEPEDNRKFNNGWGDDAYGDAFEGDLSNEWNID